MSKYLTFPEAQFKSRELLVAALQTLGWQASQIEIHRAAPAHLYGHQGDERPEVAEVIIRRKHISPAANDLGFARNASGALVPIVSEYDASRFRRQFGQGGIVPRLRTEYNTLVANQVAAKLKGKLSVTQVGQTRKIHLSY